MGWTFTQRPTGMTHDAFFADLLRAGDKIVASTHTNKLWLAVVENAEGKRTIIPILTDWDRRDGSFGYKDVPVECSNAHPTRTMLNLVADPDVRDYTYLTPERWDEWVFWAERNLARAAYQRKAKPGCTVTLPEGLTFGNGLTPRTFTLDTIRRGRRNAAVGRCEQYPGMIFDARGLTYTRIERPDGTVVENPDDVWADEDAVASHVERTLNAEPYDKRKEHPYAQQFGSRWGEANWRARLAYRAGTFRPDLNQNAA